MRVEVGERESSFWVSGWGRACVKGWRCGKECGNHSSRTVMANTSDVSEINDESYERRLTRLTNEMDDRPHSTAVAPHPIATALHPTATAHTRSTVSLMQGAFDYCSKEGQSKRFLHCLRGRHCPHCDNCNH